MSPKITLPAEADAEKLLDQILKFAVNGHFSGRRVILVDPDDATGRTRNVYEDLDEEPGEVRKALITIYPEYAIAIASGAPDEMDGMVETTHKKAVDDMLRMIDRFGYIVALVEKDVA